MKHEDTVAVATCTDDAEVRQVDIAVSDKNGLVIDGKQRSFSESSLYEISLALLRLALKCTQRRERHILRHGPGRPGLGYWLGCQIHSTKSPRECSKEIERVIQQAADSLDRIKTLCAVAEHPDPSPPVIGSWVCDEDVPPPAVSPLSPIEVIAKSLESRAYHWLEIDTAAPTGTGESLLDLLGGSIDPYRSVGQALQFRLQEITSNPFGSYERVEGEERAWIRRIPSSREGANH